MQQTLRSEKKSAAPVIIQTTAKLAETFWFVSSFVMSLLMGPFGVSQARLPAALPAIIAVFSLKINGPMPLELPR
ncbi:MAG: hypothetical protein KKE83_08745 [Proteobacteria bacterium]|nr:hypothetical protein [Pseudomonadota bacterium]MBU1546406.1 hypothetical protein [Pseudomonadota bacterium]MBU2619759.1 hypothetical protein [Pseudomonadota bacterium]